VYVLLCRQVAALQTEAVLDVLTDEVCAPGGEGGQGGLLAVAPGRHHCQKYMNHCMGVVGRLACMDCMQCRVLCHKRQVRQA
jgi:hypothetical protein